MARVEYRGDDHGLGHQFLSGFREYLSQDALQPHFLLLSIAVLAHIDIVGEEVRGRHLRVAQRKFHAPAEKVGDADCPSAAY